MFRLSVLVAIAAGCALSGCASLTTYNKRHAIGPNALGSDVFFVDAKQRAVYTVTPPDGRLRTCAEPSPDALSALAASQGLGLDTGADVSVTQALSFSEGAGSIGLRTQSIQLMRNAMFRICEGYASGALSKGSFETLHRRLQSSMVAILAIEQLTGAVKAQQITLGGGASTGSADAVQKLTQATADARTALDGAEDTAKKANSQLATLENEVAAAQKAADAASGDAVKAKALEDAKAKRDEQKKTGAAADEKAAKAKAAYEAIDQGRRAALTGSTGANSTGQFGGVGTGDMSDAAAQAISAAVASIVDSTLQLSFSSEFCTTMLVAAAYQEVSAASPAVAKCAEILEETRLRIAAETRAIQLRNDWIVANPGKTPPSIQVSDGGGILLRKNAVLGPVGN